VPFGNGKKYFKESLQFNIVTIQKILTPWKPYVGIVQSFKLRIPMEKNPFDFS